MNKDHPSESKKRRLSDAKGTVFHDIACTNDAQDIRYGVEDVGTKEDSSRPLKIRRLQLDGFDSSSHHRNISVRQDLALTHSPSIPPKSLPAGVYAAPFTYEDFPPPSGQARELDWLDRHSHPSLQLGAESEEKAIEERDDEGTKATASASSHTERLSSSPPRTRFFTSTYRVQKALAMHRSRRDMALQALRQRYAPVAPANAMTVTAPRSEKDDPLSNNDIQQSNMTSSADQDDDYVCHSPQNPGNLSAPTASQESFGGEWLDSINPALLSGGSATSGDPESGSWRRN